MQRVATYFFQAARRNQHDAALLHGAGRLGGADHLYGLAAECALKAILVGLGQVKNPADPKPYKSHIDKLWNQFDAYVQGHGPSHYLLPSGNAFAGWRVEHRYDEDAQFSEPLVDAHLQGAYETALLLQEAVLRGDVLP